MTNPFTAIGQGPVQPEAANPFATITDQPSPRAGVRPVVAAEPEPDSPFAQLGKAFLVRAAALPRDFARLADLGIPEDLRGELGLAPKINQFMARMEPRTGPASSPAFEAFARRHPLLNQVYRGITQQGWASPDVGIATIPADVQALAQTIGGTAGEFGTGLGEFKGVELGAKLGAKALGKAAPKLAEKAIAKTQAVATRVAEATGGGALGTQLGGAVAQLPRQIAVGVGQQGLADPENFGDPESIGKAVLFGLTGALADGVAFERFARQSNVRFGPSGTGSSRAPQSGPISPAPSGPAPVQKRIRDITDYDVVNSTPTELAEVAKRAAAERSNTLVTILGKTGARSYTRAAKIARSATSSPDAAASALTLLERIRGKLSPAEQKALDDLDTQGYTAGRLKLIAKTVQGFDNETLKNSDIPQLTQLFGDVLMSPSYGRNISGLYRLNRIYTELASRGVSPQDIITPITQYMQSSGVKPEEALKAVVNRMVEITGSVEQLKSQKGQGAAAEGRPSEMIDSDIADAVEQMRTGEGTVGAGFDPSLFKKLGQNMYKGDIATVAVKEGLQNAVDAITPKGSGKVSIDLIPEKRQIRITDDGAGMTPEIAQNQFMDIGGSGKNAATGAGGYGLAKVGLLANAEHFVMTTIASTPEGRVMTKIEGSADDWASGKLQFTTNAVDPADPRIAPGETGTVLQITFDSEAKLNWDSARTFLTNAAGNSLSKNIKIEGLGNGSKFISNSLAQSQKDEPMVISDSVADVEFYRGPTRPQWQTWINFHILNNGIYQFTDTKYGMEGNNLPATVTINVKSKVGVDNGDYPFTTSREAIKGPVEQTINDYIGNIKVTAKKAEVDNLRNSLLNATKVPYSKAIIVAPDVPTGTVQQVSLRSYTVELNKTLANINDMVTERLQEVVFPKMLAARFAGFGIEQGYLGVNIRTKVLNDLAKEAGAEQLPFEENLILYNPYMTLQEVVGRLSVQNIPATPATVAGNLARQAWGTMVHEVIHQVASGHNEKFSGDLTRAIGEVVDLAGMFIPILEKQFFKALEEGLFDDYDAIQSNWKKSIFGKISGHEDRHISRDAESSSGGAVDPSVPAERTASSGEGRNLSKGALGPSKGLRPSAGSPNPGDRGTGTTRQDTTDPAGAANAESGSTLRSFGADVFETNVNMGALPPYSRNIQKKILPGPRPEAEESSWFTPTEKLLAATVDRFTALKKVDKAIDKSLGAKTPAERSVYVAARLASGIAGKVHQFLINEPFVITGDGQVEFTGNKSLAKILAPLKGRLNEFRRAIVAVKAQELHDAGMTTGFDIQDVNQEIANASPDILQSVKDHNVMLRDAKRYAEEFGLVDKEMSTLLDYLGSSHVSWERVFDRKMARNKARYTALNVGNIFKDEGGGEALKIVDPIQTTVDYVRRLLRASDLNRIGLMMVEWAEQQPDALKGLIEPVNREKNVEVHGSDAIAADARSVRAAGREVGLEISMGLAKEVAAVMSDSHLKVENDQMIVRRNGKGELWRVAPEIGQALRGMTPSELHFVARILGYASTTVKAGITLDPTFAITQAFIGSFHAAMQSKNGFRLGIDSAKGFYHKIRNTPEYQKFLAGGGAFGHIGAVETTSEAAYRSVLPKTVGGTLKDKTAHPIEALRQLLQPFNEMNQMGEFLRATGRGKSVMESAFDARNVDTDFGVIGLKMQGLAHAVHFLNPYIQGTRTFVEAHTRNPNGWQLVALAGITLPAIYLWLAAEGDEEVRNMQKSPVGMNNLLVRINGEIIKIRKPILWGQIYANTAELALTKMYDDSPEAYNLFLRGITDQAIFQGMPALAQLAVGLGFNQDPTTGAPIVPEARENVEDRFKETGNESQLARLIGREFNMSPAQIDFSIKQLTGTLGSQATRALDVVIPEGEISRPTPVKADWPIVGRFFARYPSSSAEPVRTFYDRATRLEKVANTLNLMEQKITSPGTAEEYKQYFEENKDLLALAPIYADAREELAKMRAIITEMNGMPDKVVSRDRKREINDYILNNMIDYAKRINTMVAQTGKYSR